MTTKTSLMNLHEIKLHGWIIGGSVRCFLSFCPSWRFMHFWFHANLSTVSYVGREFLCNWKFCCKLAWKRIKNMYIGERDGGLSSCQTHFIGWWLHRSTQEDIRFGGVFTMKIPPINSTSAALNTKKVQLILLMDPMSFNMQFL